MNELFLPCRASLNIVLKSLKPGVLRIQGTVIVKDEVFRKFGGTQNDTTGNNCAENGNPEANLHLLEMKSDT